MIRNLEIYFEADSLNYWLVVLVLTALGAVFIGTASREISKKRLDFSLIPMLAGALFLTLATLLAFAVLGPITIPPETIDWLESSLADIGIGWYMAGAIIAAALSISLTEGLPTHHITNCPGRSVATLCAALLTAGCILGIVIKAAIAVTT